MNAIVRLPHPRSSVYIYIYIYICIYKYVYIPWRYKRDISLILPCIHQLFLQTITCSGATKELKKRGEIYLLSPY